MGTSSAEFHENRLRNMKTESIYTFNPVSLHEFD